MNKSALFSGRRRDFVIFFTLSLALLCVGRGAAQAPAQDAKATPSSTATTATSSSPATGQTEAQKKAAERKRRFEEQKALLDGGGGAAAGAAATPAAATDSEFYMEPIAVNMVAGETQELSVWDRSRMGNDVSARVSWNLSNSGIVDMAVNRHATITAKAPGTVTVTGTIDGHTVEAVVTVHRGEKLPGGVPRTVSAPPVRRTGGRRNTMTVTESPN